MRHLAIFSRVGKNLLVSLSGRLFLGLVIFPMLMIVTYLWLLSPDRYESSAVVLVENIGAAPVSGNLLEALAVGGQGGSQDEQLLQAFVTSSDMFFLLEDALGLSEHYDSLSNDFVFGISAGAPQEELLAFFRKVVTVERDVYSGLLVIRVHAYTPRFAKGLADLILEECEKFINDIGHAIAIKEMEFSRREIKRSQEMVADAKSKLVAYQNNNMILSPDAEGSSLIGIVYELEAELSKAQTELMQVRSYLNDTAPQVVALNSKVDSLKNEILDQKQRITGIVGQGAQDKLIEIGSEYQTLLTDLELAETLYSTALSSYEVARAQAGKQLKHLVVASKPQFSEKSLFPERLYWSVTWFIILVVIFSIVRLTINSIKEHLD